MNGHKVVEHFSFFLFHSTHCPTLSYILVIYKADKDQRGTLLFPFISLQISDPVNTSRIGTFLKE